MNSAQAQFFLQWASGLQKQAGPLDWLRNRRSRPTASAAESAPASPDGELLDNYVNEQIANDKAVDTLWPNFGENTANTSYPPPPANALTFDPNIEHEEPAARAQADRSLRDDRVAEGRNPGWRGGNTPSPVQPQQPVVQQPPPPPQPVQGQQAQQPTNVKTSEAHAAALLLKCASFLVKQAQQTGQQQTNQQRVTDFDNTYPKPPANAQFYRLNPETGVRTPMTRQDYAPIYDAARISYGIPEMEDYNRIVRTTVPKQYQGQFIADKESWKKAQNFTTHYGWTGSYGNNQNRGGWPQHYTQPQAPNTQQQVPNTQQQGTNTPPSIPLATSLNAGSGVRYSPSPEEFTRLYPDARARPTREQFESGRYISPSQGGPSRLSLGDYSNTTLGRQAYHKQMLRQQQATRQAGQ